MLFKLLSTAVFTLGFYGAVASAQSLPKPSDLPPASYKGQQYVDGRGCVFLRAGIGGRVNWVARISANRQPLCGYPPSLGAPRVAIATPEAAAARPTVQAVTKPVGVARTTAARERIAKAYPANTSAPAYASTPGAPIMTTAGRYDRQAVAVPASAAASAAVTSSVAIRTNGCPARSPYGKRARLSDGRASLICSADPGFDVTAAVQRYENRFQGTTNAAVAPRPVTTGRTSGSVLTAQDNALGYYAPDRVARDAPFRADAPFRTDAALRADAYGATRDSARQKATQTTSTGEVIAGAIAPPDYRRVASADYSDYGYRPVTGTGRYNSKRAQGTASGWAQQDLVWSRDVPSVLLPGAPALRSSSIVTSTSNAVRKTPPTRQAASGVRRGGVYIQAGTFGDPANASGASARLSRVGLPVAATRSVRGGRSLRVVMAGPFATAIQARQAIARVRSAGFPDAFIR